MVDMVVGIEDLVSNSVIFDEVVKKYGLIGIIMLLLISDGCVVDIVGYVVLFEVIVILVIVFKVEVDDEVLVMVLL